MDWPPAAPRTHPPPFCFLGTNVFSITRPCRAWQPGARGAVGDAMLAPLAGLSPPRSARQFHTLARPPPPPPPPATTPGQAGSAAPRARHPGRSGGAGGIPPHVSGGGGGGGGQALSAAAANSGPPSPQPAGCHPSVSAERPRTSPLTLSPSPSQPGRTPGERPRLAAARRAEGLRSPRLGLPPGLNVARSSYRLSLSLSPLGLLLHFASNWALTPPERKEEEGSGLGKEIKRAQIRWGKKKKKNPARKKRHLKGKSRHV